MAKRLIYLHNTCILTNIRRNNGQYFDERRYEYYALIKTYGIFFLSIRLNECVLHVFSKRQKYQTDSLHTHITDDMEKF